MREFSRSSLENLSTCDVRLQSLAWAVLQIFDISVLEGYRDMETQQKYFEEGKSKVRVSKHNARPSQAIHLAPFPYQDKDVRPYYYMGGVVTTLARALDIPIRWGGDWDSDHDVLDQKFNDLMHFELVEE